MHPLPTPIVQQINRLDRGEPVVELRSCWGTISSGYQNTIASWLVSCIDVREQQAVATLDPRLKALNQAVAAYDTEELLQAALDFFPLYDAIEKERERTHLSSVQPIEDLYRACKAITLNWGTREAVELTLNGAQEAVVSIKGLFRPSAPSFPVQFGMAVESGFHSYDKAIEKLKEWIHTALPDSLILQAISELQEGAKKVEPFLEALENTKESAEIGIPVLGSYLAALKLTGNAPELKRLREQGLVAYEKMWQETTDGWLLPASKMDKLLATVELEYASTLRALAAFEKDASSFWLAATRLERAFTEVKENSLRVDRVLNSPIGPEASLLIGLLNQTVPDLAAKSAIAGIRLGDVPPWLNAFADRLEAFLSRREPKILLTALEDLVSLVAKL